MTMHISKTVSGGGASVELVVSDVIKMVVHSADYPHDSTIQINEGDARDIRDALNIYLSRRSHADIE
jgi:hypothetical protein